MVNGSQMPVPPFLARLNSRVPCAERPYLFHPPDDGYSDLGSRGRERTDEAIALCLGCEVMSACRQWAREQGEFGIWGAETDAQRTAEGYPSNVRGSHVVSRGSAAARRNARTDRRPKGQRPDSGPATSRTSAWPPYLTPTERSVLAALYDGVDADDLPAELARSRAAVTRAVVGLQRKLETDLTGLGTVAREAGLARIPRSPQRYLSTTLP
jgi:hypothetical protein